MAAGRATGATRRPRASGTTGRAEEQFRYENHVRYMIPLDPQVGFLRAAGFEGVDVFWKELDFVIYGGRRPLDVRLTNVASPLPWSLPARCNAMTGKGRAPVKQADGFDAVVVGSGPNGLIGAVTLARAGLKVLLLEAADEFGGGLRSGPLTGLDGFTHDLCATVLPLARASAAFRDLDLDVEWAFPAVQAAHPLDGQDAVLVHRDVGADRERARPGGTRVAWRQTVGAAAGDR